VTGELGCRLRGHPGLRRLRPRGQQLQDAVVDRFVEQCRPVQPVVVRDAPRRLAALARDRADRTLHVAGLQRRHHGLVEAAAFAVARNRHREPVGVEVVQQAADVGGGEVGLQRPGGVDVADDPRQVGQVLKQHTAVQASRRRRGPDSADGGAREVQYARSARDGGAGAGEAAGRSRA
jgi:hypothetical protein